MDKIDFQGHHPKIRPYSPSIKENFIQKHRKTKHVLLTDKQLEVLWTKFGAYTTEKGERILNTLINLVVLDADETGKEPMCGGEIAYGGLGDCGITYADPSRPPPKKHGWIYNMMQYAAIFLFGALLMAACHKDPIPNPQPAPENDTTTVVPTDTIPTDTVPTDTITQWRKIIIYWPGLAFTGNPPSKDTIRYWLNQPDVKDVDIKFYDLGNTYDSTINWGGAYAGYIHQACDTLKALLYLDSLRVNFKGTKLQVGRTDLPNHDPGQEPGGAWYDIAWLRRHDIIIKSLLEK